VDYDSCGGVVGVERVSLRPEMFAALADVAIKYDLDFNVLFALSLTVLRSLAPPRDVRNASSRHAPRISAPFSKGRMLAE
jgi:hypothetical protein